MTRIIRLLATLATVAALVALVAMPASAHINENANAGTARNFEPFDASGFIGPVESQVNETPGAIKNNLDIYFTAHSGMECGAESSPNIGSLANNTLGLPDFECPSPVIGDNDGGR